jgi:protein-S-isoprenylcysteine O-methyltransferase Ste14
MKDSVFYTQAKISANKASKMQLVSNVLAAVSILLILGGVLSLAGIALSLFAGSSAAAWVCIALAVIIFALTLPAVILAGAGAEHMAKLQAHQEREYMRQACLHGEASWDIYPGGQRFFGC